MKKAFELNCKFCNDDLSYKRMQYGCAIYYCKNKDCKLQKKPRTFTYINMRKKTIEKEIHLISVTEDISLKFNLKQKKLLALEVNYSLLKSKIIETNYRDISYGGNATQDLIINYDRFIQINTYSDIEKYINNKLLLL